MNKRMINLTILLTWALSFNLFAHQGEHQEKQTKLMTGLDSEAAQVVTKFHQALRSKDTDSVRSLLNDDVLIYESGKAERSLEEYAAGHMKADMQYLAQIKSKLLEHQVKVSGDTAISTARFENTRMVAGRARVSISMETIVVSKIDGEWLISHIHWS
ncbi:YybH family protein [Marinicella gelatinilytica]|uniref:YybH family protein n=1 Tax=Marinicella gelatinilytica TaxID=2996017 RepID=UPI002260D463|nr:nuclear transport factor 2 family protein [Marinicella gelatinilytica]MCX7543871.1 nuclear transport factor 2 family protein [Marinicella gelatinilytica]